MKSCKVLFLALMLQLNCLIASANEIPLFRRFIIWPNFCLEHMLKDPEGCSAWRWTSDGCISEDRSYEDDKNYIHLCFKKDFAEHLQKLFHHIPLSKDKCDYATCTKCKTRIVRMYDFIWGSPDRAVVTYWCKCCKHHPIDIKGSYDKDIIRNWKFCAKPAIWNGYFQKYRCNFLDHFFDFLNLSHENVACKCYRPEESSKMREILDEIFMTFCTEVKSANITDSEINTIIGHNWHDCGLFAINNLCAQFSHSFLYSQIKEALYRLNPQVSCWFHHDEYFSKDADDKDNTFDVDVKGFSAHLKFCDELLKRVRPLFLELHQECYSKHPHPRIAKEIEVLLSDMK